MYNIHIYSELKKKVLNKKKRYFQSSVLSTRVVYLKKKTMFAFVKWYCLLTYIYYENFKFVLLLAELLKLI